MKIDTTQLSLKYFSPIFSRYNKSNQNKKQNQYHHKTIT